MIHLELLQPAHADELLDAVLRSAEVHRPWVLPPVTRAAMDSYLGIAPAVCLRYGVREPGGALAGVINVSSIIRGVFENAFLGFYALAPYAGRGFMRPGLAAVITAAFTAHHLHRLEANVQPANTRSARLVQGLGFRLEGHSPRYLKIGDRWCDHDRYALTVEEWSPPDPTAPGKP